MLLVKVPILQGFAYHKCLEKQAVASWSLAWAFPFPSMVRCSLAHASPPTHPFNLWTLVLQKQSWHVQSLKTLLLDLFSHLWKTSYEAAITVLLSFQYLWKLPSSCLFFGSASWRIKKKTSSFSPIAHGKSLLQPMLFRQNRPKAK